MSSGLFQHVQQLNENVLHTVTENFFLSFLAQSIIFISRKHFSLCIQPSFRPPSSFVTSWSRRWSMTFLCLCLDRVALCLTHSLINRNYDFKMFYYLFAVQFCGKDSWAPWHDSQATRTRHRMQNYDTRERFDEGQKEGEEYSSENVQRLLSLDLDFIFGMLYRFSPTISFCWSYIPSLVISGSF